MEISIEDIQKKFEELPEDIKWAIIEADVENKILEIGKKRGLNVSQMGQLALETNTVMLGFYPLDKFEESLKASMGLSPEKVRAIVDDVNDTILKSIRENLKETREETATQTMIPDVTPVAPVTSVENTSLQTSKEKEDTILKSAGIEIVTPKEEEKPKTEAAPEKREDMIAKVEKPELITKEEELKKILPTNVFSKLSGSFNLPSKKTEYSLQNISKAGLPSTTPTITPAPVVVPVAPAKPTPPRVDPYREPAE